MSLDPPLTDDDVRFMCELVERAGMLAVKMNAGVGVRHKSHPQDLVTDADEAISRLLVTEVRNRFPADVVVSEEDSPAQVLQNEKHRVHTRTWLIDPIDGTDSYAEGKGHYAVMVGLVQDCLPVFGCVYVHEKRAVYCGGPRFGLLKLPIGENLRLLAPTPQPSPMARPLRLLIGWRDRKSNPWLTGMPDVDCILTGSIGLKVMKIVDGDADVFINLSGRLKLWDTAGPAAIALSAGLEAGTMTSDELRFPLPEVVHGETVIIGRTGALDWARKTLPLHQVPQ